MHEITIRVRCRQTGALAEIPLSAARLAGTQREPWVAYECPVCRVVEGVAVSRSIADELVSHGVAPAAPDLAVEMLEPRPTGTILEVDVVDWVAALAARDDIVALMVEQTLGAGGVLPGTA